jgi:hypothetical protein
MMALMVGLAVAVVVLAADVLLGTRIGPPLWTCISSGRRPPSAWRRGPANRRP